ncbi:MAG: TlyA family RNA methyltransferase, partial [Bacillota bacterium]
NGAKRVYAIDVGYGQLAWSLRQDPRVVNLERTNFRHIEYEQIGQTMDLATIDVSFISLDLILPALKQFLDATSQVVALIKPQFEAGRENVGKRGVVRDKSVHLQVINKVITHAAAMGLYAHALTFSPVTGPEGNIEYLVLLKMVEPADTSLDEAAVQSVVESAHHTLRTREE